MSSRPPRKPSKPDALLKEIDVSRSRIDDPTSAFPIGALNATDDSADGEGPAEVQPKAAGPARKKPPAPAPRSEDGFKPVVAGVDLRWLALSLVAGGLLAVAVVAFFAMVVVFVR